MATDERLAAQQWPIVTRRWRAFGWIAALTTVYAVSWQLVGIDLGRAAEGLPRLLDWGARGWPPDFSNPQVLALRAAETVAMATLGTTIAAVLALPLAWLAADGISPSKAVAVPIRWWFNALRGIDSFIFALIFVAAVGLGPFAGVLGIGLHVWGSMAKLYAESMETANLRPFKAAVASGANRSKAFVFVLLPDVVRDLLSVTLFWWEFNVRASTVLGIVGAGGIGQMLKNSMDLLDFPRVVAVILVVLALVTAIDQVSALLRRRVA